MRIQTTLISVACATLCLLSAVGMAAPQSPAPKVQEVIVVFKTHFDIGYTDLSSKIVETYRTTMIDKALAVCDQAQALPPEQRFAWTVPGWPLTQILYPGQTPERRARVLAALKDGRIVYHALPFTMETESNDLEGIVRGLRFSSDLSRALGLPLPRDAKMTDVPEHTWLLPTILKHAGVDFLHLGCNGGSSAPEVPELFWWEGPDGSRLLTMYSKEYGTDIVPPAGWPHKTWLAMTMTGDNQGPPTTAQVKELFARAARELPGVKIRLGRLSDFGDAILKENPTLPVVRADMPDTWIHGLGSMPTETALAQNTRSRIGTLEKLDTLLGAWGVKTTDIQSAIGRAYEVSLLYGEHTWGMDCKRFGNRYGEEWKTALAAGKYDKLLKSFDEHRAYIREADKLVNPELEARLKQLAGATAVAGRRIVVYNPLPWRRDAPVRVAWSGGSATAVTAVGIGAYIPAETVNGELIFVARNLPPLGYRTYEAHGSIPSGAYRMPDALADAKAGTIENSYYKITLDPRRGGITSIIEKATGRELVDRASPHAVGQYLYERFDSNNVKGFMTAYARWDRNQPMPGWIAGDFGKPKLPPASQAPYASAGAAGATLAIEENGERGECATLVLKCPAQGIIADATELRVTLYRDQPYLDLEWRIANKKGDPWPEAGWLCLPLKIDSPAFRLGRVGSIVDPAKDLIPGANHHLFCLNTGMSVSGSDAAGVGICPLDSPLVSLEKPGIWQYDREFTARKAEVFVNLYNNMWSTNFPQWIDGSWRSRVRLWAIAPDQKPAYALVRPGLEARNPALAAVAEGPAGKLPTEQSGLEVSRPGVMVTAFGPNPDGAGTILRLWELTGEGGICKVKLPAGFKAAKAQPVDLRGRPVGAAVAVKDGALEIEAKPFAPLTVLF